MEIVEVALKECPCLYGFITAGIYYVNLFFDQEAAGSLQSLSA